jgi:hypothetical protein
VNRKEQLQWEARWARPAAITAFLAGAMQLVSAMLFFPKDRKGIEATPDFLLSIDEDSGAYLTSAVLSALASLLLAAVFLYLFRATLARGGGVPQWFVYLVIGAPLLYTVSKVAYAFDAVDIADKFASGEPIRGQAGADRATKLADASPVLLAIQVAGGVADRASTRRHLVRDPGVLARGPRRAVARLLARRTRAGVGERHGRAVAERGAAARSRADAGRGRAGRAGPEAGRARSDAARARARAGKADLAQAAPQALGRGQLARGPTRAVK